MCSNMAKRAKPSDEDVAAQESRLTRIKLQVEEEAKKYKELLEQKQRLMFECAKLKSDPGLKEVEDLKKTLENYKTRKCNVCGRDNCLMLCSEYGCDEYLCENHFYESIAPCTKCKDSYTVFCKAHQAGNAVCRKCKSKICVVCKSTDAVLFRCSEPGCRRYIHHDCTKPIIVCATHSYSVILCNVEHKTASKCPKCV